MSALHSGRIRKIRRNIDPIHGVSASSERGGLRDFGRADERRHESAARHVGTGLQPDRTIEAGRQWWWIDRRNRRSQCALQNGTDAEWIDKDAKRERKQNQPEPERSRVRVNHCARSPVHVRIFQGQMGSNSRYDSKKGFKQGTKVSKELKRFASFGEFPNTAANPCPVKRHADRVRFTLYCVKRFCFARAE